jgi:hypothetical protein
VSLSHSARLLQTRADAIRLPVLVHFLQMSAEPGSGDFDPGAASLDA